MNGFRRALLGYRRDLTASTLRRADRQSASIGLIIEDVSNPFFSAVHRGVEDVARPRGVLTFVGSSDEMPTRERELYLLAQRKMQAAAAESGLAAQAERNTTAMLQSMLRSLGYKEVTVTFRDPPS